MSYPVARYARHVDAWFGYATPAEVSAGVAWYAEASAQCAALAHEYNLTLRVVAGVVAALSPQVRWDRNILIARDAIRRSRGERVLSMGGAFPANVRKAQDILAGTSPEEVCTGRKVRAFFALLHTAGAADAVCVDSIAILAALGIDPNPLVSTEDAKATFDRPAQLRAVERAYRKVAEVRGVAPAACQAIVWLTYRNERDKR